MNWDKVQIEDDGPARTVAPKKQKPRLPTTRGGRWGNRRVHDQTAGMTKGDLRRMLGEAAANTAKE